MKTYILASVLLASSLLLALVHAAPTIEKRENDGYYGYGFTDDGSYGTTRDSWFKKRENSDDLNKRENNGYNGYGFTDDGSYGTTRDSWFKKRENSDDLNKRENMPIPQWINRVHAAPNVDKRENDGYYGYGFTDDGSYGTTRDSWFKKRENSDDLNKRENNGYNGYGFTDDGSYGTTRDSWFKKRENSDDLKKRENMPIPQWID